jgi:hypothetical protein
LLRLVKRIVRPGAGMVYEEFHTFALPRLLL